MRVASGLRRDCAAPESRAEKPRHASVGTNAAGLSPKERVHPPYSLATFFKFRVASADIPGKSNAPQAAKMFAPFKHQANAYSNVHVETGVQGADAHQLVSMLLDGALTAIASAVSALERGDIPAKCKAVSKAAIIIDEGLRA